VKFSANADHGSSNLAVFLTGLILFHYIFGEINKFRFRSINILSLKMAKLLAEMLSEGREHIL